VNACDPRVSRGDHLRGYIPSWCTTLMEARTTDRLIWAVQRFRAWLVSQAPWRHSRNKAAKSSFLANATTFFRYRRWEPDRDEVGEDLPDDRALKDAQIVGNITVRGEEKRWRILEEGRLSASRSRRSAHRRFRPSIPNFRSALKVARSSRSAGIAPALEGCPFRGRRMGEGAAKCTLVQMSHVSAAITNAR
jgi:hypothetical protein